MSDKHHSEPEKHHGLKEFTENALHGAEHLGSRAEHVPHQLVAHCHELLSNPAKMQEHEQQQKAVLSTFPGETTPEGHRKFDTKAFTKQHWEDLKAYAEKSKQYEEAMRNAITQKLAKINHAHTSMEHLS